MKKQLLIAASIALLAIPALAQDRKVFLDWAPKPDKNYKDAQTWCNPPDRGLGVRPTTRTGNPLVDAYLWIKIPGESDGQCDRGTGGGKDPERGGGADPAAGAWFEKQAAELIQFANPPVPRPAVAKPKK